MKSRESLGQGLVFTDAAGDEVLHASVVLKKAQWPGHPVQEVRSILYIYKDGSRVGGIGEEQQQQRR